MTSKKTDRETRREPFKPTIFQQIKWVIFCLGGGFGSVTFVTAYTTY